MPPSPDVTLRLGLPEEKRAEAARLYLEGFSKKLAPILGQDDRAAEYLTKVIRPDNALVALGRGGVVIGIAGFHDEKGGLIGGGFRDMIDAFGMRSAARSWFLMSLFTRAPKPNQLLIEGVVVASDVRSRGVGTEMLDALVDLAKTRGFRQVRLEVVDTNPRAKALYEREGFSVEGRESIWPFHGLFGFRRSDVMVRSVVSETLAPTKPTTSP
ncbi:MAG: GNAT family N-acetyltransferase [Pseudomonadota bacterium]